MEYNSKSSSNEEKGISLDQVMQYVNRIMQKWWLVVISAVVCAVIGFGIAKVTYTPTYSSTIRFAVDNKSANTITGAQSSSDINAGISLAKNYIQIMTQSDSLMQDVANGSGYKLTVGQVKSMIKASLAEDTSIIEIRITTTDPEVAYAVAVSYVNNYSTTTEKAYQSTRATVFDAPQMPTHANADNSKIIYTLLGFIIGAAAVVLSICMKIFIKDTVKSSDDISSKLNSKLLGQVIHIKKPDRSVKNLLISDRKMGFMFIESFKLIRTKIENAAKRYNYKVFIFTSAYENEGKTTVATNTALALAKSGKSVLLIDADLRKPAVFKTLGVSATNELGLTGVINGERTLSESIKYFEKFNLFLLITSQANSDSAELLASDSMGEIIDAVKNEFDYIIIDTPPGGVVADASIIAPYADACVMVVRCDHAPSRRVKKAMDDIAGTGTEILGCIFNDAEQTSTGLAKHGRHHRKSYGYGYGKGYGYGYGYGYGPSSNDESRRSKKTESSDEE